MSLENTEVVDAVGTEESTNTIVLTILDSWDWENERSHLEALQNKLNAYFDFVESGQIHESYPNAIGAKLRIDIIGRYEVPTAGREFLKKATKAASQLQMEITHKVHEG